MATSAAASTAGLTMVVLKNTKVHLRRQTLKLIGPYVWKKEQKTQQGECSTDDFDSSDSSNYDEELVAGGDEKKDWKGITLAILCIILIGCLVALSVLILDPNEIPLGPELTLEEVVSFSAFFAPNSVFSKTIWRNKRLYFLDVDGNLQSKGYNEPKKTVLAAFNSEFNTQNVSDWDVSGDGKYAMMKNKLDYEVFDLTSSSSQLKSSIANDKSQVSWAEFASSSGSSIIFKREKGGLVYKQSIRGEEIVLSESKFAAIAPDVIRKYVFDDKASAWWSPDQSSIAFAEFDMSKVPKKIVPNFVGRKNGEKEVFYPKIGDELPKTVLKVANLKTFTSSDDVLVLEPTSTSVKYLMSLLWLSEEEFIALWSDSSRRLNIYERCFVTQGSCEQVYKSEEASCGLPSNSLNQLVKISDTKIATLKRGKIVKNSKSMTFILPFSIDIDAKPASAAISAFPHSAFDSSKEDAENYVDMFGADALNFVYFRRRLGQRVHLFKQSQTTQAQCLSCPRETDSSNELCDNFDVNCYDDMTLCLVKCLYVNRTMVPFSYFINSPTELDNWAFKLNNETFEMFVDNAAFSQTLNLTTRKTYDVLFGSEKIGEKLVSYKLTRPRTLAPARFPLVVFMPSDRNVQSQRRFSFGMTEYFASKFKLSVLEIDGIGSELESEENYCTGTEGISDASSTKKINQIDSFLNKLTSPEGLENKNVMSGLDLTLNKTAFFGFENGANLALLTASIASYSVNCTLGLSLLPDFKNYVSPASSKIISSSNLKEEIETENFKKLKLISPLDDDYISPIDAIAIDEIFGLQNDMSLKLLRGDSQSLLKSDYWDFYGEYFSTCLKEPEP